MLNTGSFFASLLLVLAATEGSGVVIQALIDLDNDSEDLVKTLINKVDAIIDPKVVDSKNATQELALALLKLGPLITVSGNITDGARGLSISFSFNAKTEVNAETPQSVNSVTVRPDGYPDEIMNTKGGILQPVAEYLEPYLVGAATILANGVVSNIIAHFMNEISLLSATNLC